MPLTAPRDLAVLPTPLALWLKVGFEGPATMGAEVRVVRDLLAAVCAMHGLLRPMRASS